jgi:hypothetical protein
MTWMVDERGRRRPRPMRSCPSTDVVVARNAERETQRRRAPKLDFPFFPFPLDLLTPRCLYSRPCEASGFRAHPTLYSQQRRPPHLSRRRRAAACHFPPALVRKRDALPMRCVAHISSSLPFRRLRELMIVLGRSSYLQSRLARCAPA